MSQLPTSPGPIARVGIRVSWRGKPVLTIQRHLMRRRGPTGPGDNVQRYEPAGLMPERDAARRDLPELAIFLATNLANHRRAPT